MTVVFVAFQIDGGVHGDGERLKSYVGGSGKLLRWFGTDAVGRLGRRCAVDMISMQLGLGSR